MKRKMLLIAALLALVAVAPALASDQTLYPSRMILQDDSGIQIELNRIIVADEPLGSYFFTYPPSQYRYYQVYYTKYNPTNHDIRYQFNITFVDSKGNVYNTEDNILAAGIGAGKRVTDEMKEFPIPRNATDLHIRWYHLNTYVNEYEFTNIALQSQPSPTPTATPVPTATPAPSPATTPTPTPKAAPIGGLLPLAALGLAAGGACATKLYSDHRAGRK